MFAFVLVLLTYDMLDKTFWFSSVCWWVERIHGAQGIEARRVCSLLWGGGAWGSGWWPQKVLHGSVRCMRHHAMICAWYVLQPSWLKSSIVRVGRFHKMDFNFCVRSIFENRFRAGAFGVGTLFAFVVWSFGVKGSHKHYTLWFSFCQWLFLSEQASKWQPPFASWIWFSESKLKPIFFCWETCSTIHPCENDWLAPVGGERSYKRVVFKSVRGLDSMWFYFGRELDLVLCVLDSLSLFMSCRGQANRSFNQEGDIYIYIYIYIHVYR